MIDGFNRTFSDDNLARWNPARQCFYMHLHGSPMYITQNDGSIRKIHVGRVGDYSGTDSSHIVLTHFKYKSAVIAASPVLRSYWKRLTEAMDEVGLITLFGYSGADLHLNDLINLRGPENVRVVEWQGSGTQEARKEFWQLKFPTKNVDVHLFDDILNFTAW